MLTFVTPLNPWEWLQGNKSESYWESVNVTTFFIGESENCAYKNVEEFLDDLDHERASKIIKECFEKARDSKTN